MATDLESFLPWLPDRPEVERAWLDAARNGDAIAAAELLQWYLRGNGWLAAEDVREAVQHGARDVMQAASLAVIGPAQGKSPKVHALMYFQGTTTKGKPGPKAQPDDRLRLLAIHGVGLLSANAIADARRAIATQDPRVYQVEAYLLKHVGKLFKGSSVEARREYIHASFPNLAVRDREEVV